MDGSTLNLNSAVLVVSKSSFTGTRTCIILIPKGRNIARKKANKALVPTDGAALSAMLPVTLTRHPVSTLTPAPAVGTA
jgi:hypothetical protein